MKNEFLSLLIFSIIVITINIYSVLGLTYIDSCQALNNANEIYKLNTSIYNHSGTCIQFNNNNITFDCDNYLVDGVEYSGVGIYVFLSDNSKVVNCDVMDFDYGIVVEGDNNTILNSNMTDCRYPLYLEYSNNLYVENINITKSYLVDIYLKYSNNITCDNIKTFNSNSIYYNLYFRETNNSVVSNSDLSNAQRYGILNRGINNKIENITITNSDWKNLYIHPFDIDYCNFIVKNVNGTQNKPIKFFNYSINIENWYNNYSEINLCNADNSILRNLYRNSDGSGDLEIKYSDNVIIDNQTLYNSWNGLNIKNSNNITIKNIEYKNISNCFIFDNVNGSIENVYIEDYLPFSYPSDCLYIPNSNFIGENIKIYNFDRALYLSNSNFDIYNSYLNADTSIELNSGYNKDNNLNINNSQIDGLFKSYCSSETCGNNIIIFYNTSDNNYYDITNSTFKVFWDLKIINDLNSNVSVYNNTNNLIKNFNDSLKNIWLKEFEINDTNDKINFTPHTINYSKSGYYDNSTTILMDTNRILELFLTEISKPILEANIILYSSMENAYLTNSTCVNENTLYREWKKVIKSGNNETEHIEFQYVNCPYGCREDLNAYGDDCFLPDYQTYVLIILIIILIFIGITYLSKK